MFDSALDALDRANARVGSAHAEFLALLVDADTHGSWRGEGARDLAHWVSMRYGISAWKASRLIDAAHALERLPSFSEALSRGRLGIDKVAELCRFATPETQERLIQWAAGVSCTAVRQRADREIKASIKDAREAERSRSLEWWYFDEGRRFGLYAELAAAHGPSVVRAIELLAERVPPMPGEEDEVYASARRADALAALCSASLAEDPEPDRAMVVVHAQLDGLGKNAGGCEAEAGPVLHPHSVRRMLCNARVQTVIEDRDGHVVAIGRASRQPSGWMVRQVRYRDRECRFPGCGARRFTEAHHIVWWRLGGRTDLDNLLLICSFHHRLVHEFGWSVKRRADGQVRWLRPDGTRYRAGPMGVHRRTDPLRRYRLRGRFIVRRDRLLGPLAA